MPAVSLSRWQMDPQACPPFQSKHRILTNFHFFQHAEPTNHLVLLFFFFWPALIHLCQLVTDSPKCQLTQEMASKNKSKITHFCVSCVSFGEDLLPFLYLNLCVQLRSFSNHFQLANFCVKNKFSWNLSVFFPVAGITNNYNPVVENTCSLIFLKVSSPKSVLLG